MLPIQFGSMSAEPSFVCDRIHETTNIDLSLLYSTFGQYLDDFRELQSKSY